MRIAAVLLVLLSACQLVVGDDADDEDDHIDCDHLPVRALRDPQTGTCTQIGRVGSSMAATPARASRPTSARSCRATRSSPSRRMQRAPTAA
jgi:hypothetical protein